MIIVAFSVTDKANQVRVFEKAFLMANISPKIVFEILFLLLSDVDMDFLRQKLR